MWYYLPFTHRWCLSQTINMNACILGTEFVKGQFSEKEHHRAPKRYTSVVISCQQFLVILSLAPQTIAQDVWNRLKTQITLGSVCCVLGVLNTFVSVLSCLTVDYQPFRAAPPWVRVIVEQDFRRWRVFERAVAQTTRESEWLCKSPAEDEVCQRVSQCYQHTAYQIITMPTWIPPQVSLLVHGQPSASKIIFHSSVPCAISVALCGWSDLLLAALAVCMTVPFIFCGLIVWVLML